MTSSANTFIRILPPQLANQIAAGEVVERPASVVKELVENSIDANAQSISIEIEQGGHKRICIRDDGKGIVKDELGLALSRHATSKIRDIEDLDRIMSMGFRGEALASISSVSRLRLTSKPESQVEAWQAVAEGSEMAVDITPAAHPTGTSVDVQDLFYNTPARRRFLKAPKTELQHIEQVLKRIALANPEVAFELKHNGKRVFKYAASTAQKRVEQVCKTGFLNSLLAVEQDTGELSLKGWISQPGQGFESNDRQFLFINNRMMKDRLLMHAIRQAYEGFLPDGRHCGFVLFLSLSPDELDINVHPAKHEVRFRQPRLIHDFVYQMLDSALNSAASPSVLQQDIAHTDELSASANQHGYGDISSGDHFANSTPSSDDSYIAPLRSVDPASPSENAGNAGGTSNGFSSSNRAASGTVGRYAHQPSNRSLAEANRQYQSLLRPVDDNTSSKKLDIIVQGDLMLVGQERSTYLLKQSSVMNVYLQAKLVVTPSSSENSVEAENHQRVQQPILMPVSIPLEKNAGELRPLIVKAFEDLGFGLSEQANKLILKQVPSVLRHWPWAKIFPEMYQQVFDKLQGQQEIQDEDFGALTIQALAEQCCLAMQFSSASLLAFFVDAQVGDEFWAQNAVKTVVLNEL